MNCEECNFYTEEYSQDAKDNIPYCVKHKKYIKENDVCNDFNNNISCFNSLSARILPLLKWEMNCN